VTVRVLGLGAGGHAKVVIEALEAAGGYEIVGLLDPNRTGSVLGIPVLGDDALLERQYHEGVTHAFIGLGGAGDTAPHRRLYELAKSHGFEIVSVVHPSAVVSRSAQVGEGATVLAHAVVGAEARLGDDVIVNTGAIVEHDCRVGDHVHVASGAALASGVEIGEGAHIGIGASVRQGVRIGSRSLVGAGAAVVEDVEADVVVAGVPARVLRESGRAG
jgi:sugar O-acyltransferase (sialic acid O-acetyltransferase NeuD family)